MMHTRHFHSPRGCLSYLTYDPVTKRAALIDPSTEIAIDTYMGAIGELGLTLLYIIETHTHADHISSAKEIKSRTGASIVRHRSAPSPDKDIPLESGERLSLGGESLELLFTPGHTNESVSVWNGSELFTGDTLLIGGTGRTDFQIGDPQSLYRSLHDVIKCFPADTIVRPGHDYKGRTKAILGEEFKSNPRTQISEDEFIMAMNEHHPPTPEMFDTAISQNSR